MRIRREFIIGSILTIVLAVIGWIVAFPQHSITNMHNTNGIVTQGQTGSNFNGNNFIISPRSEPTTAYQDALLGKLRNEYILSHDGLTPALLAGTEPVSADWINKRLEQMGEPWRVRIKGTGYETFPAKSKSTSKKPARS